jgi:peptidoglycan hydrolase-like protein with peptidoglycan-binding domain
VQGRRIFSRVGRLLKFAYLEVRFRFDRRIPICHSLLQTPNASGDAVTIFQKRFNHYADRYGLRIPVTGVYDEATQSAVASFQKMALYVLNGDGFVGPVTARELRIKLLGE